MHFFEARAEMCKNIIDFLEYLKTRKNSSDIYWPSQFTYLAWTNSSLFQKRFHHIVTRTLRNALLSQFPTYSMCSSFVCKFPVLRRFQITANIGLSQEEKRSPWYFTFFSLLWKVQCNVLISIFLLSLEVQKVADKQCKIFWTK